MEADRSCRSWIRHGCKHGKRNGYWWFRNDQQRRQDPCCRRLRIEPKLGRIEQLPTGSLQHGDNWEHFVQPLQGTATRQLSAEADSRHAADAGRKQRNDHKSCLPRLLRSYGLDLANEAIVSMWRGEGMICA